MAPGKPGRVVVRLSGQCVFRRGAGHLRQTRRGSAAGPLNGPSQWLWGEKEAYTRQATLRHTAVGYTIHHVTSVGWATLHERAFGMTASPKSTGRHCVEAAATTAVAYYVDYHLTPSRFRPGFKKHLGPLSILLVYASFAGGLAAASALREQWRK